MAEARPGNRRIVHHILAFVQPPERRPVAEKMTEEEIERMELGSIFYRDGFLMRAKPDAPVHDDGCSLPERWPGAPIVMARPRKVG